MSVGPIAQFELAILHDRLKVHSGRGDSLAMLVAQTRIDNMDILVAQLQTVLHKGEQHLVRLIRVAEKCANVSAPVKQRSSQPYGATSYCPRFAARFSR